MGLQSKSKPYSLKPKAHWTFLRLPNEEEPVVDTRPQSLSLNAYDEKNNDVKCVCVYVCV